MKRSIRGTFPGYFLLSSQTIKNSAFGNTGLLTKIKKVVNTMSKRWQHSGGPGPKHYNIIPDIIIAVIIAAGLIALNIFTVGKFNELQDAGKKAMFIRDDIPSVENDHALEEILEYHNESYNMMELYDENLNLMLSIQFDTEHLLPNTNIHNYPDLIQLLNENDHGRFTLERERVENDKNETVLEEITFQWLENNRGEQRLIVVYSTLPLVDYLWIYSVVSYIIIILVFILIIRCIVRRSYDRIRCYNHITSL